ncbi:choline-binding transcriptional repressor BetI [Pontivivens insulae]|uniref:HTH-type transcriptional regulator BetI n=1 Tax=Pontivivens insulae TaxID=1639689 RepID=A0A2R8A873_9RHOB|nr:transcriptional regulator BetI [Pontivivens insulae]RED18535.1 TetR family transcriptional regulator [Pontivivens insulae]SPF28433.1 HTH-type transcriptional regulator BetI [Pontivivens insulae]
MPKVGMEAPRRAALVQATVAEVGAAGSLDVSVAQIARRAGMSSALAHHYFGSKQRIFSAAMRYILTAYGNSVRARLAVAATPRERVEAIVAASLDAEQFAAQTVSAWLQFYVYAQTEPEAARLLSIYIRRLRSNLVHALKPDFGDAAHDTAEGVAALIDGFYIRHALRGATPDARQMQRIIASYLDGAA